MKRILLTGVMGAVVLLCGCFVQSLNPLFSDKELIAYPDLVGTWKQDSQSWTFVADGKAYKLTHVDEKNHSALFQAGVGKLGTNYFMDLFLEDPKFDDQVNQLATVHLIPAHIVLKVTKLDNDLVLTAMDLKWFQEELKQNPKLIPHVMQEERPVVTATTEELQKFVSKFAADTNVFKNEMVLKPAKER